MPNDDLRSSLGLRRTKIQVLWLQVPEATATSSSVADAPGSPSVSRAAMTGAMVDCQSCVVYNPFGCLFPC